jgi:NAD(P)-dependent dehydrogenase (short-subunit alcohol dehydrogenase family)
MGLLRAAALIGAAAYAGRVALRSSRRMELAGSVALVTGGSRGLGLVLVRQLVDRGARVAICARDEEELNRARAELQKRGADDVLAVQCDITIRAQVEEMIRGVVGHFGTIDILINNAGVIQVGPMEEMTIEDYDEAMRTHFGGPLYATLAALPVMRARRRGRIVNITSIGGKVPAPHLLPYTASKFALVGFSEGLRAELVKHNIFVTTVVPGLMRTGSPRNAEFKGRHHEEYAWFSTADAAPVISISPERIAGQIIDALQHGRAELISPLAASVQARVFALFPNLASELAALVNHALPKPGGIGQRRAKGYESSSQLVPRYAAERNTSAARANNEVG